MDGLDGRLKGGHDELDKRARVLIGKVIPVRRSARWIKERRKANGDIAAKLPFAATQR
jgi:hypothetical protein